MFLARILFFRLHESPRYLVHAGRPLEALVSLQMISRFNGSDLTIELDDVDDRQPSAPAPFSSEDHGAHTPFLSHEGNNSHFPPHDLDRRVPTQSPMGITVDGEGTEANMRLSPSANTIDGQVDVKDYHSTRDSPPQLDLLSNAGPVNGAELIARLGYEGTTPSSNTIPYDAVLTPNSPSPESSGQSRINSFPPQLPDSPRSRSVPRRSRTMSLISERYVSNAWPRWLRRPLRAWLDRVSMVLSPEWLKTTTLVCSAWCAMALGMFPSLIAIVGAEYLSFFLKHTRCLTCTYQNCLRRMPIRIL